MPPIDWDEFSRDTASAAADAAAQTDEELANRISSVSRLTGDQVKDLFPTKGDAAKAAKLMSIVKGATSQNEKIAALKNNIDDLAGAVVTLIDHLS
jgi:hypothetical protein